MEAGIHFDFDPNTDIDEIPSRFLYNAVPFDSSGRKLGNFGGHYFDPGTGRDLGSTHSVRGIGLYEGEVSLFQLGWRYRGKLVIVFSKTDGNYSTGAMEYVMFNKVRDHPIGKSFAHEVGHYLWLVHTFGNVPQSRSAIKDMIIQDVKNLLIEKNYAKTDYEVNSIIKKGKIPEDILNIAFDADRMKNWRDVKDTSPDLGEPAYEIAPSIPCTDSLNIEVVFSEYQRKTYEFKPTVRKNAMSYGFRKCGCRFSPGQVHVMRKGLREKNRRQLVPVHEFEFGREFSEDTN
jgi:hypothetical protein